MTDKCETEDNIFLLSLIKKLRVEDRQKLIKHLDSDAIDTLCECVYNLINEDLGLSRAKISKLKQKLEPSKRNLRFVANKSNSVTKRRKVLSQEGEGLGLILSAAIPLISSLISGLTKKK